MKYTFLPSTNIKVSKICLGTMTFGNQNSEKEGFDQESRQLAKDLFSVNTVAIYELARVIDQRKNPNV